MIDTGEIFGKLTQLLSSWTNGVFSNTIIMITCLFIVTFLLIWFILRMNHVNNGMNIAGQTAVWLLIPMIIFIIQYHRVQKSIGGVPSLVVDTSASTLGALGGGGMSFESESADATFDRSHPWGPTAPSGNAFGDSLVSMY